MCIYRHMYCTYVTYPLPPFALRRCLRHFFKAVRSGDQLTEQAEAGLGQEVSNPQSVAKTMP